MSIRSQLLISVLLLSASLACATTARAEYAVLSNGQRLHITGYEREGDVIHLHIEGGVVSLAASHVTAIEPEEVFKPAPVEAPVGPFAELIRGAAARHGVDEHLITSIIATESNFNPYAVSRRRARGLMQLTAATVQRFAVGNVYDPAENIEAGTRYLKELLERYRQDPILALAAYNAGPERVAQFRGVPPFAETHAYVRRVIKEWKKRRYAKG